jgi:hypothetical protein
VITVIQIGVLGPFGSAELGELADEDGMIPEAGDRWSDFHWSDERRAQLDADPEWAERWWGELVDDALRLTEEALEEMPESYGF